MLLKLRMRISEITAGSLSTIIGGGQLYLREDGVAGVIESGMESGSSGGPKVRKCKSLGSATKERRPGF